MMRRKILDLFLERMVKSYFIHKSNLQGEHIEYGYYVFFKPFVNDRSDDNAKNVAVIEAPERKRKYGSKNK